MPSLRNAETSLPVEGDFPELDLDGLVDFDEYLSRKQVIIPHLWCNWRIDSGLWNLPGELEVR